MRLSTLSASLLFKTLLAGAVLFALTGCNKQPKLLEDQAVAQAPEPVVVHQAEMDVLWKANSVGSKSGGSHFLPIIESDVIYTASSSGQIQGFSLDNGDKVFSVSLNNKLASGVGVNVSTVVAVTTDAQVIALNTDDGSEKWRVQIDSAISAAPAMNDQLVVVRTVDGKLLGFNTVNGDQEWAIERPVAALSIGQDAPGLVAAEGVINGFSSGRILASNVYNGSPFWEVRAFRPGGKNEIERLIDIDASPILVGGNVIVGAYKGGMVALRVRDGSEVWRNESASTRKNIAQSKLLLAITGPESEVEVLSNDTGKTRWKKKQLRGHGLSAPAILDDSVVVGSLDGTLYFFNLFDGQIRSKFKAANTAITALRRVDQGLIVYSAGSGVLTLLRL